MIFLKQCILGRITESKIKIGLWNQWNILRCTVAKDTVILKMVGVMLW